MANSQMTGGTKVRTSPDMGKCLTGFPGEGRGRGVGERIGPPLRGFREGIRAGSDPAESSPRVPQQPVTVTVTE